MKNAHIFLELVTSKEYLRSKNNSTATSQTSRVNDVFVFFSIITRIKAQKLDQRVKTLFRKVTVYQKQAQTYEKIVVLLMNDENTNIDENELEKSNMTFLRNELSLSHKELNRHLQKEKSHLMTVAEKMQDEMFSLAIYINRVKKRLRDMIQLKAVTDLKLLQDIKKFSNFELQS